MRTSAKSHSRRPRWQKPVTPSAQIEALADESGYLRHGGKGNRRKQLKRLVTAVTWIIDQHADMKSVHQIGRGQIIDYYRELDRQRRAYKTKMDYFRTFCLLWAWLDRTGEPPRPKNIGIPPAKSSRIRLST